MADARDQSIVFEYEPESPVVLLGKILLILVLIGAAFAIGHFMAQKEIARLNGELAAVKGQLDTASTELEALKAKYSKLASGKLEEANAAMTEELNKVTAERDDLKAKLTKAVSDNQTVVAKAKALNTELAKTKESLAAATKELETLKKEKAERIAKLETMSKDLAERDKQVETLTAQLREMTVAKENAEREITKKGKQTEYYKREYEKIISKYDELRDKHLEEHPEQVAINYHESQIFSSPDGSYKILIEVTNREGKFIDYELAIYAINRTFPKFDILLFDANGKEMDRKLEIDFSRSGVAAGRVVFRNQGWKTTEEEIPRYFEIRYPE